MKNETNLNSRQKKIIKLIVDQGALSRTEIVKQIKLKKPYTRITSIRDVNQLVKLGLIKSQGKGKSTVYNLVETNPILYYVDFDDYFDNDIGDRGAQSGFNKQIFPKLKDLFSNKEKTGVLKRAEGFSKRGQSLSQTIYKRELERFVIEFSWKSSQIEGNTYDLLETETLIKQKIEAEGHPRSEAVMILNHKDAFDSIMKRRSSFRIVSLTEVLGLHRLLTKGLEIRSGIRFEPVAITGTIYRPLKDRLELEEQLKKTIELINEIEFPPEKALIAASMIAYLQPFADGNKRTSRNLANAIMLAHDYFPLSYRNVNVSEYRKTMIVFYEQNNLYHLKRIFLEQVEFAVENYFRT